MNKQGDFKGSQWTYSVSNFFKKSKFDYETVPLWQKSADVVDAKNEDEKKKGLSFWKATVFIAGEMAGSGVLALPEAVSNTGWIGILVIIVCCVNAGFAGICLGRCWLILEERWPEYRMRMRYPYPAIAYRATCTCMRYVVSFCVDFTLLGVGTVFLLLCAQLVQQLVCNFYDLSFCFWILIIAAILCPLMWLGTPSDFWPAAVGALASTAIACILLIVNISLEKSEQPPAKYKPSNLQSFFLGFGTIAFAFGGASTFPTFQNDMKKKELFPKCVIVAFTILLLLYIPVSACGYYVYGSSVHPDILLSIKDNPMKMTVEILLAAHLFFAFLIVINPPAQELEEIFNVPRSFNWKRVLLRTLVMGVVVFIAESIPHFGKILNFVGGSTVTLMTFVFPPIFYMRLCDQKFPGCPERNIPLHVRIYLIEVMIIGIVAGGISSYSALNDIFKPDAFTPPCYINLVAASKGSSCGH